MAETSRNDRIGVGSENAPTGRVIGEDEQRVASPPDGAAPNGTAAAEAEVGGSDGASPSEEEQPEHQEAPTEPQEEEEGELGSPPVDIFGDLGRGVSPLPVTDMPPSQG